MKTNGTGSNGNGNYASVRQPNLIPQDGQYVLPFSIQEDFAERLARLRREGRLPTVEQVRAVLDKGLEEI